MGKLTAKQQRFVEEYLIDLNATQAAIRAGYKNSDIGRRLVTKSHVSEAIQAALSRRSQRVGITQDWVLEELRCIAAANGADFAKVVTLQPSEEDHPALQVV